MEKKSQAINDIIPKEERLKPFIRWAGGKQNLIKEIYSHISLQKINTFFEPFLGGASFFLNGSFKRSFLSDLNPNLTNCYEQIKRDPISVHKGLKQFKTPVKSETYYEVRDKFNKHNGEQTLDQAIRFIFLNKTSFNGIYRVNRSGLYNVPYGKPNPSFSSLNHLIKISEKLQKASIFNGYYDEIESLVVKNDLIYLDPPYPKLSDTAYFNHYTLDKFGHDEQIKVAEFADRMNKKGASVIISNADLIEIRELYKKWKIIECSTYRYISCKKERIKVKELIIKNF